MTHALTGSKDNLYLSLILRLCFATIEDIPLKRPPVPHNHKLVFQHQVTRIFRNTKLSVSQLCLDRSSST